MGVLTPSSETIDPNDPLDDHWYEIWGNRSIGFWCDRYITNIGARVSNDSIGYKGALLLNKAHKELVIKLNKEISKL